MNNRLLFAAAAATTAFAVTSAPAYAAGTVTGNFVLDKFTISSPFGDFDLSGEDGGFIGLDDVFSDGLITAPYEELFPGIGSPALIADVFGGGTVNGTSFTTGWSNTDPTIDAAFDDDFTFKFGDTAAVEACTSIVCVLDGASTVALITGDLVELDYTITTTPVSSDPNGTLNGEIQLFADPFPTDTGASVPEPGAVAGLMAVGGWMLRKRLANKAEASSPRFS